MSSGNATHNTLTEALDSAIAEDAPQGRLEDSEIQRLVALSRDAAYQRSERVPVKTVEAFEPRSLVSIAMEAQRRRETEIRTATAAGAEINETGDEVPADQPADQEAGPESEGSAAIDAGAGENTSDGHPVTDAEGEALAAQPDGSEDAQSDETQQPSSTSQVDYEAGRQAGLEEGRQVGLAEGQAKGVEEGRAAGRAEASAQLERAIQTFESAVARLSGMAELDTSALGKSINAAIITLASERAGYAIAERPDGLADRVERLLATVQAVSGHPEIRLNEADLVSIQPLVETREKLRHCSFVADPDLASGDLSVTLGTIGIDDIMKPPLDMGMPAETGETAEIDTGMGDAGEVETGTDQPEPQPEPDTDTGTDPTPPEEGDADV